MGVRVIDFRIMQSLIKLTIFVLQLFCILFLISCSSVEQKVVLNDSTPLPAKRKTILTDRLACFGDMLADYSTINQEKNRVKPLSVSIMSVKDATGISTMSNREIPSDMTDLALGVATNIGGSLRITHIPGSQELFDLARVSSMAKEGTAQIGTLKYDHYNSGILLYGSLTEYDRVIASEKNGYNVGAEAGGGSSETDLNLSKSSIANLARMTMDFRVVNTHTKDLVNHASSTNTVYLHQKGKDFSLGLSIGGQSIGGAQSYTEVDARHAAIRLLIELGLVESIGKYTEVPYWKCLPPRSNSEKEDSPDDMLKEREDKDLISKVRMDYEYGEYLVNGQLMHRPRTEGATTISVFEVKNKKEVTKDKTFEFSNGEKINTIDACKKLTLLYDASSCEYKSDLITIAGKKDKRSRILYLYKKNQEEFSGMSNHNLLKSLHDDFIRGHLISSEDKITSSNMYMALWKNAPIQGGARWNSGGR